MSGEGKILVFVDLPAGGLDETGRGLLSYTSRLAVVQGAEWEAITVADPGTEELSGFGAYGTQMITVVHNGSSLLDTPASLGALLSKLVHSERATLLVFPHNDLGSTLAPVAAAALDAALLTEVVTARRGRDGLRLSRQALGTRVAETKVWNGLKPLVITVPVKALSQVVMPAMRTSTPKVSVWRPGKVEDHAGFRVIERIPPDPQTVDLTEAEVIFSAGKGCDKETFEQLKELCRLLNVSFGVTRPVFDFGWSGFERMVGQTGRTVTPRLYLALGISGSMHHVGGIKDSRRIVAVNTDPKAPIFPNSDEGFVADLKEVLPRLLEMARAAAGGAA